MRACQAARPRFLTYCIRSAIPSLTFRIQFCRAGTPGAPTWRWESGATAEEFASATCGVTSAPFDPPLVLAPGAVATVTLTYNLTGIVGDSAEALNPTGSVNIDVHCQNKTTPACIRLPTFVPSAVVHA